MTMTVAITNPVVTQVTCSTVTPSDPMRCGTATLTIDASIAPISVPKVIDNVTSHLLTGLRSRSDVAPPAVRAMLPAVIAPHPALRATLSQRERALDGSAFSLGRGACPERLRAKRGGVEGCREAADEGHSRCCSSQPPDLPRRVLQIVRSRGSIRLRGDEIFTRFPILVLRPIDFH